MDWYLQDKLREDQEEYTLDGTVDMHGRPAIREKTGKWVAGIIILCKLKSPMIQIFLVFGEKNYIVILYFAYLFLVIV